MLFFYVRHGDPIYNPDSLTPLGARQAEALAKRFAVYGLDEIYSSPSIRAQQTAQPTCELLKKEKKILDWTLEGLAGKDFFLDKGEGDGKKEWVFKQARLAKLFASPEVRALGAKWYTHPAFEGYTFGAGVERVEREVDGLLLSLGYRHDRENGYYIPEAPNEKRVALFAHEGFGASFMSALLGIPYNEYAIRFGFSHTGVTVIQFAVNEGLCFPRVLQHSNDSHLYREGLGTKYNNWLPL